MIENRQKVTGLYPEWYPQSAVLIAWPDRQTDFAAILDSIEKTYIDIVSAISLYQTVIIAVRNEQLKTRVIKRLATHHINPAQVIYVVIAYDDIWVRDIAPIAVQHNRSTQLLCFQFNAWGNQYSCQNDARFAQRFAASQVLQAPVKTSNLILEGGAFDSNGLGELLTTASCIYDQRRNQLNKSSIQQQITKALNADRLIVLKHGQLVGDDTSGHIDTLARFCSSDTIAYTSCDNSQNVHYHLLKQMLDELKQLRTAQNKPYQLIPLPLPSAIFNRDQQQLPANYANFLIINDAVLVPQYRDPKDVIAISRLGKCFPHRDMIPIDSLNLISQFGSVHCMTMNYPQTIKPSHIQ
jgi:agmatine/peptidylarginine deiminase